MSEFTVGQEVRLVRDMTVTPVGTYSNARQATTETEAFVTRVANYKVLVRFPTLSKRWGGLGISSWLNDDLVVPLDPNAPRTRKIGETPEGMIAPDDPRLMWLWEDAEKLAKRNDYCSQYDALTAALNIPGRERDFTVTRSIGGIDATFKVKARSKKLAEQVVDEKINTAQVVEQEEEN